MPYRTRQKKAVWQVLQEAERPLTALEISDLAAQSVQGIGLATIYRTLKQLQDDGQIRCIEVPGAAPHYEKSALGHHHFFLCEHCRHLFQLEGCLRGLSNLLPAGYQMRRHEIVLYGSCPNCPTS